MKQALWLWYSVALILPMLSCSNPTRHDVLKPTKVMPKEAEIVEISAVGDIMIGSSYPDEDALPPNAEESFNPVIPYLRGDVVFGNLEGVLLDGEHPPKCKDVHSKFCYVFKMPQKFGTVLKNAGFNLLSLANNHIGDFRGIGRRTTVRVLDSLGILHAGLSVKPTTIFERNGVIFGFAAFSPNQNTLSLLDLKKATSLVHKLSKEVDVLIVSFHGGGEGTAFEQVKRTTEFYIGENRGNVYEFAHAVIDAGADLVLGHGPHLTRSVELYKERLIAYSLGNFNTNGKINITGSSGIAPLLNMKLEKNGKFISAKVISTYQTKTEGVKIDSLNRAFHKIKNLTDADFNGHQLDFSKVGFIKPKN